ncbi:MAG: metallophosphoesterase family protein [Planctomycetota bacterium]
MQINDKPLGQERASGSGAFSVLFAGHVYGSHGKSVFPSSSLLANIKLLNRKKPEFMVFLGDIVQVCNKQQFDILRNSLLSRLDFPVFNAPGNHDLTSRELYIKEAGKTFQAFIFRRNMFILLDSVSKPGKIEGEQLEFLEKTVQYCAERPEIKNIFILSHLLVWIIGNRKYDTLLPYVNGRKHHTGTGNYFSSTLIPRLKQLGGRNIFFIGGDIGCHWAMSVFFEKESGSNIAYLATGVGEISRDSILQADFDTEGNVKFTVVSLTGRKMLPVEKYTADYWLEFFERTRKTKSAGKKKRPDTAKVDPGSKSEKNVRKPADLKQEKDSGKATRQAFWRGVAVSGALFVIVLAACFFRMLRKKKDYDRNRR